MDNIELISQSAIRIISKNNSIIYFDPFKLNDKYHNDADYIFITHSHYDHFSVEDIISIKKDNTYIIIPYDLEKEVKSLNFNNVILVKPNEKYIVNDINFETTYSYNINKRV